MQKRIPYFLLILFFSISAISSAHGFKVLVFSKTEGFSHQSIPDGIAMIKKMGVDHDFDVDTTEDASLFTLSNLTQYKAVIFLSTTGDVLNATQQAAFEQYIRNGGGYVGIHSASDTEHSWPWYGGLVGAYFKNHPNGTPTATIKVSDRVHPSTKELPFSWSRVDEWYNFKDNPRGKVHVLATVDEKTYAGGDMGYDHPVIWCHEYDGGRSWYTALGHTKDSYTDPNFIKHVLGGIYYAVEEEKGVFDATVDANFEVSVLDNNPSNPIALAVLPDLRVLYLERGGKIKLYNQQTGALTTAGELDVDSNREDGLIGIVLDPNFATNNWLYLFYSPSGSISKQHVSRFTFSNNEIDMSSEKILLEIPTQREDCCHSGGDLEFDKNGNLYIAVGDNTNPFASDGFSPIDERSGRKNFDAQRTSANTKDLRGKILRIVPQTDGTYGIPTGNLFANANDGLPEIYAMGVRNPFRLTVSPDGFLYFGDVGPDAKNDDGNRGPKGHDEFNRTNVAANFGWPYAIANNLVYNAYDFNTKQSGSGFSTSNPINNSPNNTGTTSLPAATPAWIWYNKDASAEFPSVDASGGRTAMAGAVYEFDGASSSEIKFPEYFHNSIFLYEWSRNWIREVKLDASGTIVKINPFLENLGLKRPIDMDFGPDGALYIIEWGTGFQGNNSDARVIKLSYIDGNQTPIAIATSDVASGGIPLSVNFDASGSSDPNIGDTLTYEWDFDGDGIFDATGVTSSHTYTSKGNFKTLLKVTDSEGLTGFATINITAGNHVPIVEIEYPANGGFFDWGETISFKINVTDVEDGTISCNTVTGLPSIGHNDHIHDLNSIANCEGDFTTQSHGEDAEDVFYVFNAKYTDQGGVGVNSTEGIATSILQPKKKEAEHYSTHLGIQLEDTSDPLGGGKNVGYIESGDYISFKPMNLHAISHITFRGASNVNGGFVELRADSTTGTLLGKRFIPVTGGWQKWDYFSMPIEKLEGTHELFFVFTGGSGFLFNLNWIEFYGKGVSKNDLKSTNGLNASYYNTTDFTGTPVVTKDPMIAFNWEDTAPVSDINSDGFSVRWDGYLYAENTGNFSLYTNHVGGSTKVVFDNKEILNKTTDGEATSQTIELIKGDIYPLTVEYIHTSGKAAVNLGWSKNNTIYNSSLKTTNVLSVDSPLKEKEIQVFPNPFQNEISIQFSGNISDIRSIHVYDLSGVLIRKVSEELFQNEMKFKFDALKSGVYLLKIETLKGVIFKKVIKQ